MAPLRRWSEEWNEWDHFRGSSPSLLISLSAVAGALGRFRPIPLLLWPSVVYRFLSLRKKKKDRPSVGRSLAPASQGQARLSSSPPPSLAAAQLHPCVGPRASSTRGHAVDDDKHVHVQAGSLSRSLTHPPSVLDHRHRAGFNGSSFRPNIAYESIVSLNPPYFRVRV